MFNSKGKNQRVKPPSAAQGEWGRMEDECSQSQIQGQKGSSQQWYKILVPQQPVLKGTWLDVNKEFVEERCPVLREKNDSEGGEKQNEGWVIVNTQGTNCRFFSS